MKSGTCPKCNSDAVYKREGGVGSSDCYQLVMGGLMVTTTSFHCYLCTACGYFENYVSNRHHLRAIAQGKGKWTRVPR